MTGNSPTKFDHDAATGVSTAWITDDLSVHLGNRDTLTIAGPAGRRITIDIDDAADLAAVLTEAVGILGARGYETTTATPEHASGLPSQSA